LGITVQFIVKPNSNLEF